MTRRTFLDTEFIETRASAGAASLRTAVVVGIYEGESDARIEDGDHGQKLEY